MQTRTLALATLLSCTAGWATAETLPVDAVACISQKDAQSYAKYVKDAPDFAADLMARAACYTNKDSVEVVQTGKSGAFMQYKLLTGHKIWVAKDTVQPTKTSSDTK